MRRFRTDLHIHTCLSPCAELDMTPRRIVGRCLERGLELIAVCDHNTAENAAAAMRAARGHPVCVLAGMEICTREEVHCLGLFRGEEEALSMQALVYQCLVGHNRAELFGDQVVVNEFDEVEGFNDRLLIGATTLSIEAVVKEVHARGGLCIASHVDRPSFSLISQLGMIPPDMGLDALEVFDPARLGGDLGGGAYPVVSASDAHYLEDIGRRAFALEMPSADFGGLVSGLAALKGLEM